MSEFIFIVPLLDLNRILIPDQIHNVRQGLGFLLVNPDVWKDVG